MTAERRNITQPADWWAAFDQAAEIAGKSLSEWIGNCCRTQLPEEMQNKLSERPTTGRRKALLTDRS